MVIKKTPLFFSLTSITNNKELIYATFPCSINHFNKGKTKNNTFYSNQKSSYQKNTLVKIVRNPTIDWHCTKPLGKNELGLWFSFITQPFSTRKHWSILLPAQNLVFRLHWERSQSSDFVASKLTNVTSLNWFSEKPVYFYVVLPFLGCLGLISGSLPNALKNFSAEKCDGGKEGLCPSFLPRFPIYGLSPFSSWQQMQSNKKLVHQDTLFPELRSSTLLNNLKDSYLATYSDSRVYFNYLNSSNLFQNLPLEFGSDNQKLGSSKIESSGQVLDFFNKRDLAFRNNNFLSNEKFQNQVTETNHASSLWEKYLYKKSKITWFWSNWAVQDFSGSILGSRFKNISYFGNGTNTRSIWEKLTGSNDYKIIFGKKNHLNQDFENNLVLNKTSKSSHSLFSKTDLELEEFAQKLFSIHLQFPKKILQGLPLEKKSDKYSKIKRLALFKSSSFSAIAGPSQIRFGDTKKIRNQLTKSNFILINGMKKKSPDSNKLFRSFLDSNRTSQADVNEFYQVFGLIDFTKSSNLFSNFLSSTSEQKERENFVHPFLLDNLFIQFSINKRLNFLKSYFPTNYNTTFQNFSATSKNKSPRMLDHTKFKKLNFPILLSGYANSDQIKSASQFQLSDSGFFFYFPAGEGKFAKKNSKSLASNGEFSRLGFRNVNLLNAKRAKNLTNVELFGSFSKAKKDNLNSSKFEKFGALEQSGATERSFFFKLSLKKRNLQNIPYFGDTKLNEGPNLREKRKRNGFLSSDVKWGSVGNWSFYWNYFKHFYGSSSLFKPWSSTFDSLIVEKPIKNRISNLLFRNWFSSPFKSLNVFPDENFLFNKWHSKKKQGFFYKRITKLEVKKRTSQDSYSRVVSLLWGFRAKYKLDEVLQYQKSKYYQSKKAQQTANQNSNQNSTNTNLNNQLVMKTLTKRRRYKKYIEFNVLSSWLRDVLYFKKIGRKLIKIKNGAQELGSSKFEKMNFDEKTKKLGFFVKKSSAFLLPHRRNNRLAQPDSTFLFSSGKNADKQSLSLFPFSLSTYFFNHATREERFLSPKYQNRDFSHISFRVQPSFYIRKGKKGNAGLRPFFFAPSFSKSEQFRAKNRRVSISRPTLALFSRNFQNLEYSSLNSVKRDSVDPKLMEADKVRRVGKTELKFEKDLLKSQSLNTSNNLFITLKNFSRLNKSNLLNSSFHSVKARKLMIPSFGWDMSASNSFLVNKTPVLLKKRSLTFSNKRFLHLGSHLSNYRFMQSQFVSKSLKNLNSFWTKIVPIYLTNFQKNIIHKFRSQPAVSNSIKQPSNRFVFPRSFLLSNKQKFLHYKFTKENFVRFNRMFILQDLHKPYFSRSSFSPARSFIAERSNKLKTNIKMSLFNKVSNFSSIAGKTRRDLGLFSSTGTHLFKLKAKEVREKQGYEAGLAQQNFWSQKPVLSVPNKLSSNSVFGFRFLSFDDLNIRFKNLASSFVIWRNKFQIRRDYLLLSYIYLDYLGTLMNSLTNSSNFLKLVHSQDSKIRTLSSNFDIQSNYFVQSENYKTNLLKPFWSFSIIYHLKNNHISVYEQLFNSFDPSRKYTEGFLTPKPEFSTSITNFGVLPKKSMSSFIQFNRTSSVFFDRSIAFSPLTTPITNSGKSYFSENKPQFFSFSDSTTLNKNYLDYKTKLLNQKIILLKRQKLLSSFSVGLKQVKFSIKKTIGAEKVPDTNVLSLPLLSSKWSKFKYRRKPGIYKSRIVCKETKLYMGTLFQNLGIHLVGGTEQFGTKESVKNLTFWLCTIVFHLCLLATLITNYKISIHFCLKTLYSSLFILNKYFVYAKYRIQRLITYIYRNNLENVFETMQTGVLSLKTQSFLIVQKLNFSFKSFQQDFIQLSKLSLTNNSFNKLFFLPYSYISSRESFGFSPYLGFEKNGLFQTGFKSKILMLIQYIQSKYQTPFSTLQLDSNQLDKVEKKKSRARFFDLVFGGNKVVYKSKVDLTDLQVGEVAPSLASPSFLSYTFAVQDVHLNNNKVDLRSFANFQKNEVRVFFSDFFSVKLKKNKKTPDKVWFFGSEATKKRNFSNKKQSFLSAVVDKEKGGGPFSINREGNDAKSLPDLFGRFLTNKSVNFIGSEPQKNIKLYFKVLKWNMLLTLLIGESEVLAELEPYREMHWYFLKKFPIFLRTSSTKDYLSMSEYQADEKIRIIKQKIRQTIMILYLRTRKYESKLQNRATKSEKTTNSLVRNRLNRQKLNSNTAETNALKPRNGDDKVVKDDKTLVSNEKSEGLNLANIWKNSSFNLKFRRRKIKKLSFWKSLLTFLGRYSFLSRSVTLSKRFRESIMMFSYPLVVFGPIGTIFLTYGLKKFILDFDGENEVQRTSGPNNHQNTQHFSQYLKNKDSLLLSSRDLPNIWETTEKNEKKSEEQKSAAFFQKKASLFSGKPHFLFDNKLGLLSFSLSSTVTSSSKESEKAQSSSFSGQLPDHYINYISKKMQKKEPEFDLEFFTDVQKFVKKYNRVYFSLKKTLNNPYQTKIEKKARLKKSFAFRFDKKPSFSTFPSHFSLRSYFEGGQPQNNNIANKFDKSSHTFQTLKLNDFYDWSCSEKFNKLGKNSIFSDTFDPKLRYYRFSTNFSKVLSDVGGFYTNIAAQQELGPIICKIYTGWERTVGQDPSIDKRTVFSESSSFGNRATKDRKQSAKNYLLVSGSTNPEAVLLLIQALSAEMGMKLFMEDAKRLQRIGRRGINKATKRLEKLFDIAQANSPALVFIEDIHVIGAKTKMLKVDEEQDDVEILSRSLLSKLIYRKYHKNKSLRESFIDQNLFTGGSSRNRRRSLKPTNPIPTSLVLYQLTRRRSLSNFFKSQENPSRRLNNKLFLSKKLSPAFTTNAVLIWKLFKSKIATPNKRIKEAPWYHIPVDAMRSINPLTYSIRVKVAKITLLAIFTMGTRLRLVKDLIRLFEKIQFESYQNFLVFATTNKLSTLDPNLRRPGRLEETISLEGLTGSASSSRSPAFMTILDTFKVHLKNVPGFSKTFNIIDNTLFSTSLNLQEWTVINYLAENAYYSLDSFKHNSGVKNLTQMDKLFLPGADRSTQKWAVFSNACLFFSSETVLLNVVKQGPKSTKKTVKQSFSETKNRQKQLFPSYADLPQKVVLKRKKIVGEKFELGAIPRDENLLVNLKNQNQRMTSFATKNKINSPFSLFSFDPTSSNSTASYWQSLFSNILLQRKTGLFTFNKTFPPQFSSSQLGDYPEKRSKSLSLVFALLRPEKFNLFLIFAYSRSGQSLLSFLVQHCSNFGLKTNQNNFLASESQNRVEKTKLLDVSTTSLMFDSDYLMNFQLWPEIVNRMSFKKSNMLPTRRENLQSSFFRFFGSKVGEIIFLNSVSWTTGENDRKQGFLSFPKTRENLNQNRFIMYSNSGLHNIYNTTSSWIGAYASIKNVVTTSVLYSKTPLLGKLLRLEDVSKPRQKQFFESLNAAMLFEYSDFHYRAFFKKNNISTEENLNLLINQKYMLNNQGRPLRKYVKLEHSNRLWLFRILYTELGSLDNITLNPTSMNYYYRNKIALKQVFKLASYQWWNWHLRKPVEQLEDIQEIAYFPCENKYYTPRRRRWVLTNGFWGYWFSFDKNFYFDLYEQYMLQTLHFACLQLDQNREVLDYLAKLYIYKEKLSETDIIFALKRYKI
jgi:hypothetical protein